MCAAPIGSRCAEHDAVAHSIVGGLRTPTPKARMHPSKVGGGMSNASAFRIVNRARWTLCLARLTIARHRGPRVASLEKLARRSVSVAL